jgi:hypothetical protein
VAPTADVPKPANGKVTYSLPDEQNLLRTPAAPPQQAAVPTGPSSLVPPSNGGGQ